MRTKLIQMTRFVHDLQRLLLILKKQSMGNVGEIDFVDGASIHMYESNYLCNINHYQTTLNMKVQNRDSDSENDSSPEKIEPRPAKNELKGPVPVSDGKKLDYLPGRQGDDGAKGLQKAETKVMKSELKKEKQAKGMLEYFGQKDKKKEVDKLAYPPPEKEIPIKVQKPSGEYGKKDILAESVEQARIVISKMKSALRKDKQKLSKGELAYHKVKYIQTLAEKMSNVYVKREFIENRGLRMMEKWLDKIVADDGREYEPCLSVKLGVIKILRDMNLTTEQLEKTRYLTSYIHRNRMSQVEELRELSMSLVKQWEYNTMMDYQDTKK